MYSVELTDDADDDLLQLDMQVAQQVIGRLNWLGENAEMVRHQALSGRWRGFYRLRAGDYRVLYTLDHERQLVIVEVIGHRSDVYRRN